MLTGVRQSGANVGAAPMGLWVLLCHGHAAFVFVDIFRFWDSDWPAREVCAALLVRAVLLARQLDVPYGSVGAAQEHVQ